MFKGIDLSLVPTEDLIETLQERCESSVCLLLSDDKIKGIDYKFAFSGSIHHILGLLEHFKYVTLMRASHQIGDTNES